MSSQSKTAQQPVSGKNADKVFKGVAYACGILILVVLAAVALFLLFRAWPLIGGDQKANSATISNFTGGKASSFWGYVGPLLFGTVLISALALLISFFVSVGIALFISHYAPKKLATALSYVVDLLAAIPSVISVCGAVWCWCPPSTRSGIGWPNTLAGFRFSPVPPPIPPVPWPPCPWCWPS